MRRNEVGKLTEESPAGVFVPLPTLKKVVVLEKYLSDARTASRCATNSIPYTTPLHHTIAALLPIGHTR
jgi:spore maturation protein SpmB